MRGLLPYDFPNFREQRCPETCHWEAKARQALSWGEHGATVIQTRLRFVGAEMWRGRGGPSVAAHRAISAASLHRASIYPLPRASFSPGWGLAHAAAGVGEGHRQGAQKLGCQRKGVGAGDIGTQANNQERPNLVVPGSEAESVFPFTSRGREN